MLFQQPKTDKVATQECDSNSVKDVEFSENISENQSNIISCFLDLLFLISFSFQYTLCMVAECGHVYYLSSFFSVFFNK